MKCPIHNANAETTPRCTCGELACEGVDDSANHQCGGPGEACMLPGCRECGTPIGNRAQQYIDTLKEIGADKPVIDAAKEAAEGRADYLSRFSSKKT